MTLGSSLPPRVSGQRCGAGRQPHWTPCLGHCTLVYVVFLLGPDLFQESAEWLGWVLRMGTHSPSCQKCFPISNFSSFKNLIIYILTFLFRLLWVC